MCRRENFGKILHHVHPEKLIVDLGGNPLSSMEGRSMYRLMDFLGLDLAEEPDRLPFGRVRRLEESLLRYFDIDTRSVGHILRPQVSPYKKISDNEYIDEWGIRRTFNGMYWDTVENPLKGATVEDLQNYPWPEPGSLDINEIEAIAATAKQLYEETDYIICGEHPVYGIFELGCWLCGFDDFLLKMALDSEFVHALFEILLDYQKQVIDVYYGAVGRYIHYTSSGDDFATQNSLFMSPEMFRDMIKPYFKERIIHTKKYTQAAYLHHSCGSVFSIIEDLIECGVDILNPIQPAAKHMQPEILKNTFGNRIIFHGGIDTQQILPFGSKDSIYEAVESTINTLNRSGGYIFAAAHNIQEDVPPQNIIHMFEAAKKFGGI